MKAKMKKETVDKVAKAMRDTEMKVIRIDARKKNQTKGQPRYTRRANGEVMTDIKVTFPIRRKLVKAVAAHYDCSEKKALKKIRDLIESRTDPLEHNMVAVDKFDNELTFVDFEYAHDSLEEGEVKIVWLYNGERFETD